VGFSIADCQLPISNWRLPIKPIGNRKSEIANPKTHPLPRGGTDFIAFDRSLLEQHLMEYRYADVFVKKLQHPGSR
jgi:hypothetical protein